MSTEKPIGQVIQIYEARIRDHLGEMVRRTVEGTLSAMLDAEAELAVTNGAKPGRIPGLAATSGRCVGCHQTSKRLQTFAATTAQQSCGP